MRAHVAEGWGRRCGLPAMLLFGIVLSPGFSRAQTAASPYQGSVVGQKAVPEVLPLSLDQAIQMGLKNNLGLVLAGVSVRQAGGERLQALQPLLPTVNASITESVQQTNLRAEGLNIPGFPAVIGPYGYTDVRASLNSSLIDLSSLRNYLAAKNNFTGANLSAQDAKDMVVLTRWQRIPVVHLRTRPASNSPRPCSTPRRSRSIRPSPTMTRERLPRSTCCGRGWIFRPRSRT